MSTAQATKLMTAEEFYEFAHRPENAGRSFELVRGEVVEVSRAGKRHGLVCGNVTGLLRNYAVARKWGYVCSNDTGTIVSRDPDTVRGPDVLFFTDAESADQVEEKYGDKPPLLAVEVLSPNDTHGKIIPRLNEQFALGTKVVWILDPDARNVIAHYPTTKERVIYEHQDLTEDILPGFTCRVAEFFNLPGR
jgi:Uma2 family endonuclease